jgi:hypothetical protein
LSAPSVPTGTSVVAAPVADPRRIPATDLPDTEVTTLADRLRSGLPLFLLGAALVVGAWVASAERLRIFSSPYPVWILLTMNATVLLGAGFVGTLIREPPLLPEDDPDLVHVPRARWELLLERLEESTRKEPEPTPPPMRTETSPITEAMVVAPLPVVVVQPPPVLPAAPSRARVAATVEDASTLRREMALFELRGIAVAAITTGQKLGGEELQALLEGCAVDLAHLSELLGAPRRRNEAPTALLVRLLRRSVKTANLSPARVLETERLVDQIRAMDSGSTLGRRSSTPLTDLGVAADEFEALLEELTPKPAPRDPGSPGTTSRTDPPE